MTLPPLSVHSFAEAVSIQPLPLQAFCPAQPFVAPAQAPWPLQALMPAHWTGPFGASLVFSPACAPPAANMEQTAAATKAPFMAFRVMTFPPRGLLGAASVMLLTPGARRAARRSRSPHTGRGAATGASLPLLLRGGHGLLEIGRHGRDGRREDDLDPAVAGAAGHRPVAGDGLPRTVRRDDQVLSGNLRLLLQVADDVDRARRREVPVGRVLVLQLVGDRDVVGVAGDLDLLVLHVGEDRADAGEDAVAARRDHRVALVEEDLVDEVDLDPPAGLGEADVALLDLLVLGLDLERELVLQREEVGLLGLHLLQPLRDLGPRGSRLVEPGARIHELRGRGGGLGACPVEPGEQEDRRTGAGEEGEDEEDPGRLAGLRQLERLVHHVIVGVHVGHAVLRKARFARALFHPRRDAGKPSLRPGAVSLAAGAGGRTWAMSDREQRGIVAQRQLAPGDGEQPRDPVAEAEARLAAVLAEVAALDVEVEALSEALADFGRRYEQALAGAFTALGEADRLTRRLQRLEDEVGRLARRLREGEPEPEPEAPRRARAGSRRSHRKRRRAGPEPFRWHDFDAEPEGAGPSEASAPTEPEPEPELELELESEAAALKRVYRRLARVLHPDLAQDREEQGRLGELMARVNAAYAKGDRTTLELMAEKVGAGEPLGELSPEERLAHLARRAATLENVAASLRREQAKLARTDTFRLRAEALAREEAGGDWFAETSKELREEEAAAAADAVARLDRLTRAARELDRARRMAMGQIAKRGPTGTKRAFDPLQESALVRKGAALLERQRATGPARELARLLEEEAAARPWEVALSVLALFLEESVRPPPAIETGAGFSERWDLLRAEWEGAPDLARALARLPRHLAAGVRIALARPSVAEIGRAVLSVLGPPETCKECAEAVVTVHLLRTRGLDELNGLVCPRCGAIQRSYWRYGEPEGLEALAPWALKLGLVAEQGLALAGTVIGFQMLPEEHEALTAAGLRDRFAQLYLTPYDVALDPAALSIAAGAKVLKPGATVGEAKVALAIDAGAGTTPEALLELLRGRVARRFKR